MSIGYDARKSRRIKKALGGVCSRCGSEKKVWVIHVDKDPHNYELGNCRLLCCTCVNKQTGVFRRKWESRQAREKAITEKLREERIAKRKEIFKEKFGTQKYYTASQLASKMGVTRQRIHQLKNEGRIPCVKVSQRLYLFARKY